VIQATNFKNSKFDAEINFSCNLKIKGIEPYFILKRIVSPNDFSLQVPLYKSEVVTNKSDFNYKFQKVVLLASVLTEEDMKKPLLFEIFDAVKGGLIGFNSFIISSDQMDQNIRIHLKDQKTNQELNTANIEISVIIKQNYSFIEYLRGGLQISLIIGIDFTASNKEFKDPSSLHYISSTPNSYERAILSCGSIVSYYDYDQQFPVFGFGALVQHGSNIVDHCFSINLKQDPNIYTINNILDEYRRVVSVIRMYGPTHFAPLLNRTLQILSSTSNDSYYILMILTDGQILDLPDTIDSVVQLSFLPVSIIIVGVGRGDFSSMDRLDADTNPLFSSNGVKACRDIVQFVEFNKFENDGSRLAGEVLAEIPGQVEGYYKMINKIPGDPINLNF
jgi:hypothetical protein